VEAGAPLADGTSEEKGHALAPIKPKKVLEGLKKDERGCGRDGGRELTYIIDRPSKVWTRNQQRRHVLAVAGIGRRSSLAFNMQSIAMDVAQQRIRKRAPRTARP
jgi:hypothetical protein